MFFTAWSSKLHLLLICRICVRSHVPKEAPSKVAGKLRSRSSPQAHLHVPQIMKAASSNEEYEHKNTMNGMEQSEKASADKSSQKPHKTRGPSLKPDTVFQCGNVEGLVSSFRWLVDNATSSLVPDAVTCQFILGVDTVVEIRATSKETPSFLALIQKQPESQAADADGKSPESENPPAKKYTVSVASALAAFSDDAERLKTQRALARAIVEAIQDVDGYRYFEKQVWGTKGPDGCRFRFPCVDSLQNRERAANRYAKAKALNMPVDESEHGECVTQLPGSRAY